MEATLAVDPRNATECASSARYWESLLENHQIPYLLLRVADMRYVLESKVTALLLYEEVRKLPSGLGKIFSSSYQCYCTLLVARPTERPKFGGMDSTNEVILDVENTQTT